MAHETGSPADWYYEDFTVGQVFRTQGRTITETDLVSFAGWSWDTNPVHTDAEHSAHGRFHHPIAHGGSRTIRVEIDAARANACSSATQGRAATQPQRTSTAS